MQLALPARPIGRPVQPIVVSRNLLRRTARNLAGKIEAAAVFVQAVAIAITATVDKLLPGAQPLLYGLAALHAIAAVWIYRKGGPFVRGGPATRVWIGAVLLMPLLMANLLLPGEYGTSPACVQLCAYPIGTLVVFAFYPWLGMRQEYLRPSLELLFVFFVAIEPFLIVLWLYHDIPPASLTGSSSQRP